MKQFWFLYDQVLPVWQITKVTCYLAQGGIGHRQGNLKIQGCKSAYTTDVMQITGSKTDFYLNVGSIGGCKCAFRPNLGGYNDGRKSGIHCWHSMIQLCIMKIKKPFKTLEMVD